ncbi:MAG: hypothetical protein ACYCQJ_12845 [Nitrososphaerales archaeon]
MTRTSYWIKEKGYQKLSGTKIELFVQDILDELGLPYTAQREVTIAYEGKTFTFRPDYRIKDTAIMVQGPVHDSDIQRKKTDWIVKAYNANNLRVILIHHSLCLPKFRAYLKVRLALALASDEPKVEIPY